MDNFKDLHYNSISSYLKNTFGCRIVKLSVDGGFTCPNRDGKLSYGGCTFCSGDGSGTFTDTIENQIKKAREKWNEECKYIVYFQSYTNTYARPEYLRMLWDNALSCEGVIGLAIATRPDCIDAEILSLLDEYNQKCFLWVELGLQTQNERTAEKFNRCYPNATFEMTMNNLSIFGIKTVIHMILGLPGENSKQYKRTAEYISSFKPFGIKIHSLNLIYGTAMGEQYIKKPWKLLSEEEYATCVVDILELMPQKITVHRLTGDAPKDMLIAPEWTKDKHHVLNTIQQEFKKRDTWQGKLA